MAQPNFKTIHDALQSIIAGLEIIAKEVALIPNIPAIAGTQVSVGQPHGVEAQSNQLGNTVDVNPANDVQLIDARINEINANIRNGQMRVANVAALNYGPLHGPLGRLTGPITTIDTLTKATATECDALDRQLGGIPNYPAQDDASVKRTALAHFLGVTLSLY